MCAILKTLGGMACGGLLLVMSGCLSPTGGPVDKNRFIQTIALPQGGMVAVAEGDYEPRSLGSYSVRYYGPSSPEFPFDDFRGGQVRSRPDGFIEKVLLKDLDGDKVDEVVVVFRCVGRGSYLSAEAFHMGGGRLGFVTSLKGLPAKADLCRLLAFKLKPADVGTPEWFEAVEEACPVSDDQGHGPDPGSVEWISALDRKLFPDDGKKGKTLGVGSRKWMEAVDMVVFR